MTLKGNLDLDAVAKGRYDSVAGMIPAIDAKLLLANGYAKSADYPAPIEDLTVDAVIQNQSGKMTDFLVDLSRFGFVLEGEAVNGRMKVRDLEKLIWDGEIAGGVDLEKIMTIFPIEGTSIAGRIEADVASKGSYAAVEAGKYSQLETRGTMDVSNFN